MRRGASRARGESPGASWLSCQNYFAPREHDTERSRLLPLDEPSECAPAAREDGRSRGLRAASDARSTHARRRVAVLLAAVGMSRCSHRCEGDSGVGGLCRRGSGAVPGEVGTASPPFLVPRVDPVPCVALGLAVVGGVDGRGLGPGLRLGEPELRAVPVGRGKSGSKMHPVRRGRIAPTRGALRSPRQPSPEADAAALPMGHEFHTTGPHPAAFQRTRRKTSFTCGYGSGASASGAVSRARAATPAGGSVGGGWVIERTMSWLTGHRRRNHPCERKPRELHGPSGITRKSGLTGRRRERPRRGRWGAFASVGPCHAWVSGREDLVHSGLTREPSAPRTTETGGWAGRPSRGRVARASASSSGPLRSVRSRLRLARNARPTQW